MLTRVYHQRSDNLSALILGANGNQADPRLPKLTQWPPFACFSNEPWSLQASSNHIAGTRKSWIWGEGVGIFPTGPSSDASDIDS